MVYGGKEAQKEQVPKKRDGGNTKKGRLGDRGKSLELQDNHRRGNGAIMDLLPKRKSRSKKRKGGKKVW